MDTIPLAMLLAYLAAAIMVMYWVRAAHRAQKGLATVAGNPLWPVRPRNPREGKG